MDTTQVAQQAAQATVSIQTIISLVAAAAALAAVIVGPFVSLRIAKRQIKASVVSKARLEWINTFRNDVAEYAASVNELIMALQIRKAPIPPPSEHISKDIMKEMVSITERTARDIREIIRKLTVIERRIQLWLDLQNPNHLKLEESMIAISGEIAKAAPDLQSLRQVGFGTRLNNLHGDLIVLASSILQQEWQKVQRGE